MKSMKTLKTQTVTVFPDDNVDLLIEEVERRPVLYDKHTKGYSDIIIRNKEWDEVAIALKGEETWNSMTPQEKKEAGYQLRKRWLNLRNCFARELRVQRFGKSRSKRKKRRKYCYFDQMMFLLPSIELRGINGSNDNSDEYDDNLEAEYIDTSSPPHDANQPSQDTEYIDMQMDEQSIDISVPSTNTDCDEDKLFVMSLVPLLRRLTNYEKLDMKVKILNLFKSRYHAPLKTDYNSSSCQETKQHPVV